MKKIYIVEHRDALELDRQCLIVLVTKKFEHLFPVQEKKTYPVCYCHTFRKHGTAKMTNLI